MRLLLLTITFSGLGLTSCGWWNVGRPGHAITIDAPAKWSASAKGNQGKISTGWLKEFQSPELERTVDQAIRHNHELQIAAARVREARENSVIARSRLLPSASISGGSALTDAPEGPTRSSHSLGLAASWEIDLWGRLRNLKRAAYANEEAALHDFRAARLSLAANTAKAWCDLISAEQEVGLAEFTLESFEKNLRIIERNFIGTGEGALDIQFGRNNVFSAKRALESRTLERDDAARSLELLLGSYPDGKSRHGKQLPGISKRVPAGIPAELIERRPDLAAARARLLASTELTHAARKSLLPSLALTGSSGSSSGSLSELLDLDTLVNILSARLTQTLTEGGAVTANARAAVERHRAEIHRYAQSTLIALREVESTLAADRSLSTQEEHLAAELRQADLAERQSQRDYSEGVNPNILSVLEAQRRANNARASMIRLNNQRLQNRIDLHLALGGDFETPNP